MSKKKVILFSLIFALTASFAGNIATPMADTIKEQKAQKKKLEKKRAKEAEKIEKLKSLLSTEQDRYIKQFSQLETLLNKMNTQSGYLNSLHG